MIRLLILTVLVFSPSLLPSPKLSISLNSFEKKLKVGCEYFATFINSDESPVRWEMNTLETLFILWLLRFWKQVILRGFNLYFTLVLLFLMAEIHTSRCCWKENSSVKLKCWKAGVGGNLQWTQIWILDKQYCSQIRAFKFWGNLMSKLVLLY